METILVAVINAIAAIIVALINHGITISTSNGASGGIRNRKAWLILGLIYWILIGYFTIGISNVDILLNFVLFIPIISIPFSLIWPTRAFHASALVFLAFAMAATAIIVSPIIHQDGGSMFRRVSHLPALWLTMLAIDS